MLEHSILRNDQLNNLNDACFSILDGLLNLFFSLNLSWNNALKKQICFAKVTFTDCRSSWFFNFSCEKQVPRIEETDRVPVFIDLCRKFVIYGNDVRRVALQTESFWVIESETATTPNFARQDDSDHYTSAYLHFEEGIIQELEIVDWGGLQIEAERLLSEIETGQHIFRVNDKSIVSELLKQGKN